MFWRRYRPAQLAGRPETQSLAAPARRGDDVRLRRQFGPAPRRAWRVAAWRHPAVRAGAVTQRRRGAARAAGAVADARAVPAGRPYRREPPALDDLSLIHI